MPRLSSNAKIFERKGNPWVSRKEGEKDFGRVIETEDAEYDFNHRFHHSDNVVGKPKIAAPRPVHRDPKPAASPEFDYSKQRANILAKMNSDIRSHSPQFTRVKAASHNFQLCPGCRHASCAARMRCAFPFGEKK